MNKLSPEILQKAKTETIYNIYLYLSGKTTPHENESLASIIPRIESSLKNSSHSRDIRRLTILKNSVLKNDTIAYSKINNLTRIKGGLTACTFTRPNGEVSVVFKGTGSGEWLDNGEGLSGIPEGNTYITYEKDGNIAFSEIRQRDFATDQQVEALNWFRFVSTKNHWNEHTKITVSGHSKGGNKAQFVAINSDNIKYCFSFSGQGFSPEAIRSFKNTCGSSYSQITQNIFSFSSENDYVNVLGSRLMPECNIYYFKAKSGIHFLDAILDKGGNFRSQCEQGKISLYIEKVSRDLMKMNPSFRKYATRGVMNVFQKYFGDGETINGNFVSPEETIAGLGIAISSVLYGFYNRN